MALAEILATRAARKLVKWSAHCKYAGDPERVEVRGSELAALIDACPGKLFKLLTACGFVAAALSFRLTALLRRMARAGDEGTAPAIPKAAAFDAALMVRRAAQGDQQAWERLVEQYSQLILAMTRDFKLSETEAADVSQATWLRLLEHIDRLDHPGRVSSWLAAVARNECLRTLNARTRVIPVQDDAISGNDVTNESEDGGRLPAGERAADVREALSRLPWRWRQLLEMLMADPPATYAEISDRLGIPVGSIGPTRGRALEVLRRMLTRPDDDDQGSGDAA
jgi:RNA polymerase sigma factor (sigma-70 family)